MDPPRILVGHIPNVGLGNQLIAIVGYLAHALLSRRVLFLQTAAVQCDTTESGSGGIGATSLSPLCNVFEFRHERVTGTHSTQSRRQPIWHFLSVLERSRTPGRLQRLLSAYPKALSLTARATPGRQVAFDHMACGSDAEGGEYPLMLTMKTSMYYTSLLQLNSAFTAEAQRLFSSSLGGRAGASGHPYEGELDVFGPLFRFLLRPTPQLDAEVQRFSRDFFHRPYPQHGNPSSGAPLILGVHARVQDGTQQHASQRGASSISRLEAATKRCARKRSRELSRKSCGGACNQSVHAVVFVASDDSRARN